MEMRVLYETISSMFSEVKLFNFKIIQLLNRILAITDFVLRGYFVFKTTEKSQKFGKFKKIDREFCEMISNEHLELYTNVM